MGHDGITTRVTTLFWFARDVLVCQGCSGLLLKTPVPGNPSVWTDWTSGHPNIISVSFHYIKAGLDSSHDNPHWPMGPDMSWPSGSISSELGKGRGREGMLGYDKASFQTEELFVITSLGRAPGS